MANEYAPVGGSPSGMSNSTIGVLGALQALFIVAFFCFTDYSVVSQGQLASDSDVVALGEHSEDVLYPLGTNVQNSIAYAENAKYYPFFQDVHVMIFIGFGFLMTFLKKNAFNSLGLTFLMSVLIIQWYTLFAAFVEQSMAEKEEGSEESQWHTIYLSIKNLIAGDFAAGAVLITYGVLLGKVSTMQLIFISLIEVCFYSVNEQFAGILGITDVGGSMVIHMFGAYFGLAAAMVLKHPSQHDNPNEGSVYHSDLFSMIGTVFLWMFWPSFNSIMAFGPAQSRAVLNTVLSLCGSCMTAFFVSAALRHGKFSMVDIQNATLAGGVAIGTCADLLVGPGASILIGSMAGLVAVVGYVIIQPAIAEKWGLHDTGGVNNLHGMPSLIGALAGVIYCFSMDPASYGESQLSRIFPKVAEGRTAEEQGMMQLAYLGTTLVISIVGGLGTAFLVKQPAFEPLASNQFFKDDHNYEVPDVEDGHFATSK